MRSGVQEHTACGDLNITIKDAPRKRKSAEELLQRPRLEKARGPTLPVYVQLFVSHISMGRTRLLCEEIA